MTINVVYLRYNSSTSRRREIEKVGEQSAFIELTSTWPSLPSALCTSLRAQASSSCYARQAWAALRLGEGLRVDMRKGGLRCRGFIGDAGFAAMVLRARGRKRRACFVRLIGRIERARRESAERQAKDAEL